MPLLEEGYKEVTVVIDGALSEVRNFGLLGGYLPGEPEESFEEFLTSLKDEAKSQDLGEVEVYVLEHGHPIDIGDEEDVCAQYEQDHHPYLVLAVRQEVE